MYYLKLTIKPKIIKLLFQLKNRPIKERRIRELNPNQQGKLLIFRYIKSIHTLDKFLISLFFSSKKTAEKKRESY
jgi:hypothetical protein